MYAAALQAVRSGTERAEAWTLTIQRAFRELCAATMAPFSRLHGSKGVCCDHEHSERKLQVRAKCGPGCVDIILLACPSCSLPAPWAVPDLHLLASAASMYDASWSVSKLPRGRAHSTCPPSTTLLSQALPTDSPDGLATKLHGAGGAHSDISSQSSCDSTSSGSEDSSTDASTPSSPSASLACVLSATKPSTDTGRPATTDTASPAEPAPITLSTAACQWDGHWPSTTRTPSCLVHTFDNDSALARALGVQGQLQLFAVATSPHPVEHPHVHQFLQLLPQRLNSFAADPYIPQRTLQGILAATLNEGWTHAWDGGDAGVGQRVCDLALVIAAPDEGRLWSCAVGDCRVMAKVAHGGVGVAGDWEDLTCDSTNP